MEESREGGKELSPLRMHCIGKESLRQAVPVPACAWS
jgi:hypothetical protein